MVVAIVFVVGLGLALVWWVVELTLPAHWKRKRRHRHRAAQNRQDQGPRQG